MSATVNISQMKRIVEFLAMAKRKGINVPIYIHGKHAKGKTSIVRQVSGEIGFASVILNLANQTPEDLLGYPDGKGGYIVPGWLKSGDGRGTIYFLDEINRAPKYVLQCMFNFINEGRIHQTSIGPHDLVIAAGNPADANYDTTEFDDKAFVSRFAHFYLEPTQLEFIQYLEGCRTEDGKPAVHPAIIKVVRTSPEAVSPVVEQKRTVHVEPDNRAIEKIGRMLNIMDPADVPTIGYLIFSAMVGSDLAAVIVEVWKNTNDIPTPERILSLRATDGFGFSGDQLDIITAVNGSLASHIANVLYVRESETFSITKAQLKCLSRYLGHIPRDCQVAFVAEVKNRIGVIAVELFEAMDPGYLDGILDIGKTYGK